MGCVFLVLALAAFCFYSGRTKQETLKDKVLAFYAINQNREAPRGSAMFEHGQIYSTSKQPPPVQSFVPYIAHGSLRAPARPARGSVRGIDNSDADSVYSHQSANSAWSGSSGGRPSRSPAARARASYEPHY